MRKLNKLLRIYKNISYTKLVLVNGLGVCEMDL